MTLIELGRTQTITDRTTPALSPFVRAIVLGPFVTDAALLAEFPGLDESDRPKISITGVFTEAGVPFSQQTTIAGMIALPQSFYWNPLAQTLHIHLAHSDNPMATTYLYGLTQGLATDRLVYVDGVAFLPLITHSPAIWQQQDIEGYDRLAFVTASVELSNTDGRLDDLRLHPIYGNDVIIYYLDDQSRRSDNYTSADMTRIASLFVQDYDISLKSIRLRVQDRRKSQNIRIPDLRFTSASYPNASNEVLGTVIPVLWGSPREIPTVITNGETSAGNVRHRAALLLTALGTVYVRDDDAWVDVTANVENINLATGEFQIPAAQGRDANDNPLPAKLVEPTGIAIDRLTDIIIDANERFAGVPYNDSTYDDTEWEAEETAIATGAYYLDADRALFDVIHDIQNGANVGFRYEITPEGRRTIRVDNETRETAYVVPNIVVANRNDLRVTTDSSTLAAEIVVSHSQSYQSGRAFRVIDDESADDVETTYGQRPRKSYDTLLTAPADAVERAAYVRARFDRIRGIVELVLMGSQYLTTRIYDILRVEVTPDEPTNMRRPFFGTWDAKVLSVAPDPASAINTVTAVLIGQLTRLLDHEGNPILDTDGMYIISRVEEE